MLHHDKRFHWLSIVSICKGCFQIYVSIDRSAFLLNFAFHIMIWVISMAASPLCIYHSTTTSTSPKRLFKSEFWSLLVKSLQSRNSKFLSYKANTKLILLWKSNKVCLIWHNSNIESKCNSKFTYKAKNGKFMLNARCELY